MRISITFFTLFVAVVVATVFALEDSPFSVDLGVPQEHEKTSERKDETHLEEDRRREDTLKEEERHDRAEDRREHRKEDRTEDRKEDHTRSDRLREDRERSDRLREEQHERRGSASRKHEERHREGERKKPHELLDERLKQKLVNEKSEELVWQKQLDFFLNNPNTKFERDECFAKYKTGQSVDFVIDLAVSPSLDKTDKYLAESPMAFYLQRSFRSASRAYRDSVELFIELVTYGMKSELTHSVIYEKGQKWYIQGKDLDSSLKNQWTENGNLENKKANLEALWPEATESITETFLSRILKNDLGRMTKVALMNRDNGLPTVMKTSRHSKPIFTIVISDGVSGAKIHDLTEDLSRTAVIDVGNHRFVKNMKWDELQQLANYLTLNSPQQLVFMAETFRMMACCAVMEETNPEPVHRV